MIYNKYTRKKKKVKIGLYGTIKYLFSNLSRKQKYIAILTDRALRKKGLKDRLFSAIEIETVNRCNGKCSFCPVSLGNDKREYKKMSNELFSKIIDELKGLNYSGDLALFSNNEPFIDDRIVDFARQAREQLPHAHIYLYTNASLLTIEKFKAIIEHLDEMIIDNYNDNLEFNPNVSTIKAYIESNSELNEKVKIHLRKENEVLFSRGGNAPNKKNNKSLSMSCILPFVQMIVRPDGRISLCSNDAYGQVTLGDLNYQTLEEVWFGQNYIELRQALSKGRKNVDLCRFCDSTFYPGQFGIKVKGDKKQ